MESASATTVHGRDAQAQSSRAISSPPQRGVYGVPQVPACLQGRHRRLFCFLPAGLVVATHGHDEPDRHRPMLPAVQADVSPQVVAKVLQPAACLHVQLVHDPLEQGRQEVFPAERERRGQGPEAPSLNQVERLPHEALDATRHPDRCESGRDGILLADFAKEAVEGAGVGPAAGCWRAGAGRDPPAARRKSITWEPSFWTLPRPCALAKGQAERFNEQGIEVG